MFQVVKRLLVGRRLRGAHLGEMLLPKRIAVAVFCSDPISSLAYATEQVVLVLAAGGLSRCDGRPGSCGWVALLLVTVLTSYPQTCFAYPSGELRACDAMRQRLALDQIVAAVWMSAMLKRSRCSPQLGHTIGRQPDRFGASTRDRN